MDMIILWNDNKSNIILPVNPETFEISGSQNNTSLFIHNLGEINLKGKRGLYSITLESFFPNQQYDFEHSIHHKPYDFYCKKIKSLYEKNTTVHLVITGTDINMFCTIESFNHGEQLKNRDVSYSITFKEYREYNAQKRITTRKKATTYTWKKGDTWSKVCKKYLGSSKTWKTVKASNKTVINKAVKTYKKKHKKIKKVKEETALIGYKVVIS